MRRALALIALAVAGCAPRYHERPLSFAALPVQALPPAPAPAAAITRPASDVPPEGISPGAVLRSVVSADAGVHLTVLTRAELPVAITAVIIHAGSASDGADIGAAELAAELLANAVGATARRVEPDAIVLEIEHLAADFPDVANNVARVLRTPPAGGFAEARRRALARARLDLDGSAREALSRELYELPTGRHPYGHAHAPERALGALPERAVRSWLARQLSPQRCELVVVGSVEAAAAKAATEHAFGGWNTTAEPAPVPPTPLPATGLRIVLADHPGASRAVVRAGMLDASDAPAARDVALGLSRDLAGDGVGWFSQEHPTGPALVGLSRTLPAADAPRAVRGMLAALGQAATADTNAVEGARRRVVDEDVPELASLSGAIAELERAMIAGAPPDAFDARRSARREVPADAVRAAARRLAQRDGLVVVVSGDAKTLAGPLSAVARVVVVSPTRDFVIERTVSHDPSRKAAP